MWGELGLLRSVCDFVHRLVDETSKNCEYGQVFSQIEGVSVI